MYYRLDKIKYIRRRNKLFLKRRKGKKLSLKKLNFKLIKIFLKDFKKSFKYIINLKPKYLRIRRLIQKRIYLIKKYNINTKLNLNKILIKKYIFLPKFCHIKQTTSNIFVTLSNYKGNVFFTNSGGNFKIKKKRQIRTTSTALKLGELALNFIRKTRSFNIFLFINYRIKGYIIRSFLQALNKDYRLKIKYIINSQKFSHNGCRFKKKCRK